MSAFAAVRRTLARPHTLLALYLLAAIAAAVQGYFTGPTQVTGPVWNGTHHNNFDIFRLSFRHLLQGKDLYVPYPLEQFDLYKYSPTFALLFAPFALLPVFVGLCAWNLLNAWVLFEGLRRFPFSSARSRTVAWWLCLVEGWGSLQHCQANSLIAGLLLLAFTALEERRHARASLFVLLTAFIKLFGLAGIALYAFQPRRRRLLVASLGWCLLLAAGPLLVVSPAQLAAEYRGWLDLLRADYGASLGYSVMGWLHAWLGVDPDKGAVLAVGALAMALPFLRVGRFDDPLYRRRALAALLIWIVIFNHKAEGATFVIAMAGVGVWFGVEERGAADVALLAITFALVSLAPTEVFPRVFRDHYVRHYALKAMPCILVWLKCLAELLLPPGKVLRAARRG